MKTDFKRLSEVNRYKQVPVPLSELNNIAAIASEVCEAQIAVISLIDDQQENFIALHGSTCKSILLDKSFCMENLLHDPFLAISDVASHKKFSAADLAIIDSQMRFYAGATLTSPEGLVVGRLYVLDKKPRQLSRSRKVVYNCLQGR